MTITATNEIKTYGQTFSGTAYTQTGLVTANGDTITGVTETSTGAPVSATVGSDPIVPSAAAGSGLSNYTIDYVNGTLTVNPATLTITAASPSKAYGMPDPPLTYAASGFESNDTPGSVLTGSLSRVAGEHVAGGPYAITQGTLAANANYTIAFTPGALTITQDTVPLVITANPQSKVYGAAMPTLTVSYSGFVNGDTAASLSTQPTISSTANASSPVSVAEYAITASGALDGDYKTISYAARDPDSHTGLLDPHGRECEPGLRRCRPDLMAVQHHRVCQRRRLQAVRVECPTDIQLHRYERVQPDGLVQLGG